MKCLKEKARLLGLCLLAIMLLAGVSSARTSGFHATRISGFPVPVRFSGYSGIFFNASGFSPLYSGSQNPMTSPLYYYDYGINYDTSSRYDNFPYSTGSRYDNFPHQARPLAQYVPQSRGNTYNSNNTYNYYYGGAEGSAAQYGSASYRSPSYEKSEVGIYYEKATNAFKDGDYAAAAENFQRAARPANKFMPLAYIQALFANGNYKEAAEQLRLAIDKYSENDGILFPVFLYPGSQILLEQIEKLRGQADTDSDLQLLAGYQLFGVKKFDHAAAYLNKAKSDSVNEPAAMKLLLMMKKAVTTGPLPVPVNNSN